MRPSEKQILMEIAELWSKRGTCSRANVGCVVVREGRTLVSGYNGAPSGLPHCVHTDSKSCNNASHAEANAIAWAARHGIKLEGSEIYSTKEPCKQCAMLIVNAGITKVYFRDFYRLSDGSELLREANVAVERIEDVPEIISEEYDARGHASYY